MPETEKPIFFWLHIKKCGGTSFRETFTPPYVLTKRKWADSQPFISRPKAEWNDILNNYKIPLGVYDNRRMLFAKEFLYEEEEFKKMYKFVIVRNPFDRIVSAWKYLFRNQSLYDVRFLISNPKYWLMKYDFNYFLTQLPKFWKNKADRNICMHTLPIWPDITDKEGNLLVDEIFKLEEIDQGIASINEKLGTSIKQISKMNVNRSENAYHKYYNKKSINLVENLFSEDLERLGYDFNEGI